MTLWQKTRDRGLFLLPAVTVELMDVVSGEGVTKLGNGVPQLRFGSWGPGSYIPSKR